MGTPFKGNLMSEVSGFNITGIYQDSEMLIIDSHEEKFIIVGDQVAHDTGGSLIEIDDSLRLYKEIVAYVNRLERDRQLHHDLAKLAALIISRGKRGPWGVGPNKWSHYELNDLPFGVIVDEHDDGDMDIVKMIHNGVLYHFLGNSSLLESVNVMLQQDSEGEHGFTYDAESKTWIPSAE